MPSGGIRPKCKVDGCGRPHNSNGYCNSHYYLHVNKRCPDCGDIVPGSSATRCQSCHGKNMTGLGNPRCKLTKRSLATVLQGFANGTAKADIAKQLNVSRATIGRVWRYPERYGVEDIVNRIKTITCPYCRTAFVRNHGMQQCGKDECKKRRVQEREKRRAGTRRPKMKPCPMCSKPMHASGNTCMACHKEYKRRTSTVMRECRICKTKFSALSLAHQTCSKKCSYISGHFERCARCGNWKALGRAGCRSCNTKPDGTVERHANGKLFIIRRAYPRNNCRVELARDKALQLEGVDEASAVYQVSKDSDGNVIGLKYRGGRVRTCQGCGEPIFAYESANRKWCSRACYFQSKKKENAK
jgi:hypothetical protein